ncbi:glycosyltransferase [soil metagenome]
MTRISVVIVNYNVKDLLENCLNSIYKANDNKYDLEIYVVDNNSIDKSSEMVRKGFPAVHLIKNEKNVGFSKANNQALKLITGEFVLILNPDTVLSEKTFEKLIEFYTSHPDTGAISSKLILSSGKLDSACRRSFPTPSVAIPRMLGLSKLFPKSKMFAKYNLSYADVDETLEVDAICGAFMFIPKPVLDKTGFFDEEYFMYGEDLDLCYRIKKNGYRIFYFPEVTTIHFKGESTKKTHLSYVNNFYGAMSIFVKKNFTGTSRFLSFVLQSGIFYRQILSYFFRIMSLLKFTILDAAIIFSAFIIAVNNRFGTFPNNTYLSIIAFYIFVWIMCLTLIGSYTKKFSRSLKKVFNGIVIGFFINASITFFFKEYAFSREVVLNATIISFAGLCFWRLIYKLLNFIRSNNILAKKPKLLIVSESTLKKPVEEELKSKYSLLHFNDFERTDIMSEIKEVIQIEEIDEVVFSSNSILNRDILDCMWSFRNKNVRFKIIPTEKDIMLSAITYSSLDNIELIEIEYNLNNKWNIFLKGVFDFVISFLLLITLYPVMSLFMSENNKNSSYLYKKLKLLPVVLTGKYSLVGNPMWLDYGNYDYMGKKGLAGLIQLNYHENINEEEFIKYNLFYAKNQSITLDSEILLRSVYNYFTKKKKYS